MSKKDWGNPPWPLLLKVMLHGPKDWQIAAGEELSARFPGGAPDNYLAEVAEWESGG